MIHSATGASIRRMAQTFDGLWASLWAILSSNVIVAGLTFVTLALTSQTLAPAGLGLLVLIEAYGRLFDQILRLEPTQALIRLATDHKNDPSGRPFRRLVKFGIPVSYTHLRAHET